MSRVAIFVVLFSSCSAVTRIEKTESAKLVLLVEPENAGVVVDDRYIGTVASLDRTAWVKPGPRRIMVRAQGFETERFDIVFKNGDEISLELKMIAEIEMEEEEPKAKRSFLKKNEETRP